MPPRHVRLLLLLLLFVSSSYSEAPKQFHVIYPKELRQNAKKAILWFSRTGTVTSSEFQPGYCNGKNLCGCTKQQVAEGVANIVIVRSAPQNCKLKKGQNVVFVGETYSDWRNITRQIEKNAESTTSEAGTEDHSGCVLLPTWSFAMIAIFMTVAVIIGFCPFLCKTLKTLKQKRFEKKHGKKKEDEKKAEKSKSVEKDNSPTGKPMKDALPKLSDESKKAEPVTSAEFEHYLEVLGKLCSTYHDDPEMYNVTPNAKPGFVYKKMPRSCPKKADEFTSILLDLKTTVMEGMTHWQHPRYHASFPSGRSYPDILADVLSATYGAVGFSWDSGPVLTEMEHAMMNWLGRAYGLPEAFLFQGTPADSPGGGVMLESISDSIFNAITASRQWKIQQLAGQPLGSTSKHGVSYDLEKMHEQSKKLVYYTSKDAHSDMEKACKLAMVRCRSIQAKGSNEWGITGTQIEQEIVKDIDRGLIPTHIHVTLGTTSTASSDHLDTIWPVAKKYDMWIHVDASYAGNCWIEPKYRTNCSGLEHVNSLNIDCDKFLLHSMPCSMFWTRNLKIYQDAFAITPVYLKPSKENTIDLRDWHVQLSHKFKALKTWMLLRMYGLEGVRHFVNHLIDMGAYFESLVRSHPNCRIFGHRNFGLFCFQYYEPGMTEKNISTATTKLCLFINAAHRLVFTHSKVGPHNLIRVMVSFEQTTRATVDASWCILKGHVEQFKTAKDNCLLSHLVPGSPLAGHTRSILPGDMDNDLAGSENQHTDVTVRDVSRSSSRTRLTLKRA